MNGCLDVSLEKRALVPFGWMLMESITGATADGSEQPPEEVEPTVTIQDLTEPSSEPDETISADVSLPTMPVSAEVPESSTASRPVREYRPPAWLKDYECEH